MRGYIFIYLSFYQEVDKKHKSQAVSCTDALVFLTASSVALGDIAILETLIGVRTAAKARILTPLLLELLNKAKVKDRIDTIVSFSLVTTM